VRRPGRPLGSSKLGINVLNATVLELTGVTLITVVKAALSIIIQGQFYIYIYYEYDIRSSIVSNLNIMKIQTNIVTDLFIHQAISKHKPISTKASVCVIISYDNCLT
jgi:hypothetical protein